MCYPSFPFHMFYRTMYNINNFRNYRRKSPSVDDANNVYAYVQLQLRNYKFFKQQQTLSTSYL